MSPKIVNDICKLTLRRGKYVKSHLIPQAFTRPSVAGEYFISGGEGSRPKRNWTSWYDHQLVTRQGERILEEYDNWAIAELRRLKLVWSGWRNKTSLELENWKGDPPRGYGIRHIECKNPDMLRLFFLSLLWRAAATTIPEFHAVELHSTDLERLRIMMLNRDPYPLDFYPTSLLQIITRGPSHNLGPVVKDFGGGDSGQERIRTFRYYFDGLVVHMYHNLAVGKLGTHCIGFARTLSVRTQTWEDSFQFANMKQHIVEGTLQWPEVIRKLTTASK